MERRRPSSNTLASRTKWSLLSSILSCELPPRCISLLDIGCGQGDLASEVVGRVNSFIGIDQDANCVLEATARFASSPIHCFIRGSFENLDDAVGSATFDCAVAILSLHHAVDLAQVCHSVSRHLRVGGRFIVIDLFATECRTFVGSLGQQLVFSQLEYLGASFRTAHKVGWRAVLGFISWRVGYCLSARGWRHMREDYRCGIPPSLPCWREALHLVLPGGAERVLIGGLLLYVWTRRTA